jgi:hypothetical protein
MYFKHENGSYKRVPIYPNAQLGTQGKDAPEIKGGMTIYYTNKDFSGNGDQYITSFPPVSNDILSGDRNRPRPYF